MSQEIPKPVIVVAIIVVVALAIFIGKSFMGGSPTASPEERAKFVPSWIDPVTNKPKAGATPQTGGPGSGSSGMGGARSGGPTSGGPSSGGPTSGGR